MDNPLSRGEHEEFRRAVEKEFEAANAENNRQNHRLDILEQDVKENRNVISTIYKIQESLETMCKELTDQGTRLKKLEDRDGEKWRDMLKIIGTAVVGAAVGALFAWLGLT
ncbi:MAG: hypothetical protein LUD78_04985 [Clostridiales bacterium]|nr:hypothetical protein [Clostridiales bacterium]